MTDIILLTANPAKALELNRLLQDVGFSVTAHPLDTPETGTNLHENALIKARAGAALFPHATVLADDSGLEVDALGGAPGVYSARYAGPEKSDQRNMEKLLHELRHATDRSAQFRTVLALIANGQEHVFEGIVRGTIISEQRGSQGFGYDPVFVPNGHTQTFAEITATEKNAISHRARALEKLVAFLAQRKA
jgi:XTP/dITP diphosphohydrolase